MTPVRRRIALVAAVALLVTAGAAVAARIGFTGETNSTNTVANGWIGPPTALASPTPSGYDAQLAWTPGTHGPVTGQQLWGVDNGTTSNCTGVTYSLLNTMASAATATFTKANTSAVNGHWLCYQMVSTSASSWTSSANFAATQLGLVATSVSIANSGTSGKITTGDTITITFNQPVLASSVPTSLVVCTGTSATVIFVGDTSNCTNTSDGYSVGVINGITVSGGKQKLNSSAVVSGSTVTVTIGQNGQNASGTGTFTPATGVQSQASTDRANACTASNCQPTTSGSF
jgi:hypothetical protein